MIVLEQVPLEEDADEDVCHYRMPERGRLILDTVHGRVIIDVRAFDVNAFIFYSGRRVDYPLIKPKLQDPWRGGPLR